MLSKSDFAEAINGLDEDLAVEAITAGEKRSSAKILRIAGVAACIALLAAAGLCLLPMLRPQILSVIGTADRVADPYGAWCYDFADSSEQLFPGEASADRCYDFLINAVIAATLEEVLPGSYYEPGSPVAYSILKLQVKESVIGEGFPETLFYRLPEAFNTDHKALRSYDTLLLSVRQIGVEEHPMLCRDSGEVLLLPNLYGCDDEEEKPVVSVVAFRDGQVVMDLWEHPDWKYYRYLLDNDCVSYHIYPAVEKESYGEVVQTVLQWKADYDERLGISSCTRHYALADFESPEMQKALAYVKEGSFAQTLDHANGKRCITYTRVIGGIRTNEQIRLFADGSVERSEGFTESELRKIPDLGAYLTDVLHPETLLPTHTPGSTPEQIFRRKIFAKYFKQDGKVFGVVRVTFLIRNDKDGELYLDDSYFYIDRKGSVQMIERETLRKKLQTWDKILTSYSYGCPAEQC